MKNSFKEKYSKFKEVWSDPRKRAGIKLLSYFIFFFVFILLASIINNIESRNNIKSSNTTTTTLLIDKYNDKQNKLLTDKYNISYVINIGDNEYKINGTLENNIVNGYLELVDVIKKIIIKDNSIYEIINNEEVIYESGLNVNYINLENIINLIKQNRAIITDSEKIKTYTYDIDDIRKIVVSTNEENITEIKIEDELSKYILNFDN